jgi:hypothetical protein
MEWSELTLVDSQELREVGEWEAGVVDCQGRRERKERDGSWWW